MRVPLAAWLIGATACTAPAQSVTDPNGAKPVADSASAVADTGPPAENDTAAQLADVASPTASPNPAAPCRSGPADARWWHAAVGYEIFVRSFADSNGDGIGDLQGVIQKFDYLNDGQPGGSDLGVNLLWLMPIFPSPSYHGYDVTDYQGVHPQYGSAADLDALVKLAHSRGVKVILDFVPNHASKKHPFFSESAASSGHNDWFVWRTTAPEAGWKQPWAGGGKVWQTAGSRWYYGVFSSSMPDWNWTNADVAAFMAQNAEFWLGKGVDGLRLDAVRYLVETGPGKGQQDTDQTLQAWQAFSNGVAAAHPEALLVGEAWASNALAAKYQTDGGLPMTFDFDLQSALLTAAQGGIGDGVAAVACGEEALLPNGLARGTFLSNHDQTRWASQLPDAGMQKVAEALLFFLPGTPFLYYGEEIGAPNGTGGGDEAKRLPMRWDDTPNGGFSTGKPWQPLAAGPSVQAAQTDPQSLLHWVRQLAAVRLQNQALQRGSLTFLPAPDGWLLAVRTLGSARVLGMFRLDDQGPSQLPPLAGLGPVLAATDLLDGASVAVKGGVPVLPPMPKPAARWIALTGP